MRYLKSSYYSQKNVGELAGLWLPAIFLLVWLSLVNNTELHGKSATIESALCCPPAFQLGDMHLERKGQATLKWLGFMKIYDAAFYMPEDTSADTYGAETPMRLVIEYHRNIPAERLVELANRILEESFTPEILGAVEAEIERVNAWYQDVQPGDVYALTHHPEQGTTLSFNGQTIGTINNPYFADIYFKIWLGEHPLSSKISGKLLGRQ